MSTRSGARQLSGAENCSPTLSEKYATATNGAVSRKRTTRLEPDLFWLDRSDLAALLDCAGENAAEGKATERQR